MPDFDKIGREVRAMFTGSPVEPETEEGRMVADLRYPGWREKGMPPLVPTPEAVERWGHWWWKQSDMWENPGVVWVDVVARRVYNAGNEVDSPVFNDGSWLGPVLERPVKREGRQ